MKRLTLLLFCYVASVAPSARADEAAVMAVLRTGCTADAQKLCTGVKPGSGRILACLKDHKDSLSDQCKQAAQRAASMGSNTGSAPPAAPQSGTNTEDVTPSSSAMPDSGATSGVPDARPGSQAAASPASRPARPAAQAPSSSGTKHGAAAASAGSGAYLRLKKAQISYAAVAGGPEPLPGIEMLIPTAWEFNSAIRMNSGKGGCICDRFSVFWEAKSADGKTKFQGIPNYSWKYSDDRQEMQNLMDPKLRERNVANQPCPVSKPLNAEQYFRQSVLNDLKPAMTVVSIEPFPTLEQLVRQHNGLPPSDGGTGGNGGTRVEAIRARLEFQKDDEPMEAWFTVALVTQTNRVGRGYLYDLHALGQMAFGAPKGQLDANDKLFKVMIASARPTPQYAAFTNEWLAKYYQVHADVENAVTQTYLHMSANAQRVSDQGFRATEQNIRDVQTYRDPSTGRTFELSNQYGHAWLNGANEYVMSDDPNFNPNSQLSGNWSELQAVPP
jgi:Cysteine rich repeat